MSSCTFPVEPAISVIIPTRNGASSLRELLTALFLQTRKIHELLVVDSSSTDSTISIAKEFGARVVVIPQQDFDHGGSRTLMAKQATGEILVFLTQDAIPADSNALEKLIVPLVEDEMVAVTYGRQLPNPDATDVAAHLRLFNYPPLSVVRCFADRESFGLQTVFASNSFAAYRRSALAKVEYFMSGLIFGEDTCTVGRLLSQGYKAAYVAEAEVFHSHNYTFYQEFRRSFDIGVLHVTEQWLLDAYGKAEGRGWQYIQSGLSYLAQEGKLMRIPDFIWRVLLKFMGYQLGRHFQLLPYWLISRFSLHHSWWAGRNGIKRSNL